MGYSHITWSCPFFAWDAKRVVKCEAGRITFPDREAEREYHKRFCANVNGWPGCSLAQSMNEYYDRLEEEDVEKRRQDQRPGT